MKIIKQDLFIYLYTNNQWLINWYKNDYLHREDGVAAVDLHYGELHKMYFIRGNNYSAETYWLIIK